MSCTSGQVPRGAPQGDSMERKIAPSHFAKTSRMPTSGIDISDKMK